MTDEMRLLFCDLLIILTPGELGEKLNDPLAVFMEGLENGDERLAKAAFDTVRRIIKMDEGVPEDELPGVTHPGPVSTYVQPVISLRLVGEDSEAIEKVAENLADEAHEKIIDAVSRVLSYRSEGFEYSDEEGGTWTIHGVQVKIT